MKKIGSVLYHKLMLQAEEAEEQGMGELSLHIKEALGSEFDDDLEVYAQDELEDDVHQGLWKLATCVLKYYNVNSVDAEKLDRAIESTASKFVEEIEAALDSDLHNTSDPLLPGETK